MYADTMIRWKQTKELFYTKMILVLLASSVVKIVGKHFLPLLQYLHEQV